MNYFIATDRSRSAIYGIGNSEKEAEGEANSFAGHGQELSWVVLPATVELFNYVKEFGGCITWEEKDGYCDVDSE